MADKITLDLFLNSRGALTSIEDLREGIKVAKKELETLEIGSEQFNRIAAAVGAAGTKVKQFEKQVAGLTREEIAGAYARIGGGISSSFAAATAAVNTFGIKSEAVTEAAVKAQNLLTIAISTRQIQEGLLSAKLLANIVAQNAYNASVAAGNAITRTFYATVAANPFGAILVLIGALVSAVIALSSAFEEQVNVQQDYNKAVLEGNAANAAELAQIDALTAVIYDNTRSREDQLQAYEQLKEIVPALGDLTLDEALANDRLRKSVELYIKVLQARAKAEAAAQVLAEGNKKLIEIQAKGLEDYSSGFSGFLNGILGVSQGLGYEFGRIRGGINDMAADAEPALKQVEAATKLLEQATKELVDVEIEYGKETKNNTKGKEKNEKATKEQELAYRALKIGIKDLTTFLEKEIEIYKELADVTKFEAGLPDIIEKVTSTLKARDKVINKQAKDIPSLLNEIGIAQDKINGVFTDATSNLVDYYGKFTEDNRRLISKNLLKPTEEFGQVLDKIVSDAVEKFGKGIITQDAFNSVLALTDNYRNLNETIKRVPEIARVLGADSLTKYYESLKQVDVALGKISYEYKDGVLFETEIPSGEEFLKARQAVADFDKTFVDELSKEYTKLYQQDRNAFAEKIKESREAGQITKDQFASLQQLLTEGEAGASEVAVKLAEARLKAFQANTEAIIEEENKIRTFFFQVQEGQIEAIQKSGEAVGATLANNLEQTRTFLGGVVDARKTQAEQIAELDKILAEKGLEQFEITEEQKLAILKYYLEQQQKEEDDAAKKRKKQYTDLAKNFKDIAQAINGFASVIADSYKMQLERLQISNEAQLEQIVGDTEQANAKRIELTKEYEAQKKAIEKQAEITSLRFSLLNAVANSAEAISKTYAAYGGTPAAFVAAAIAAAVNVAQVGIITQQLNMAKSMKQGGFIVNGPSHEQGGVMMNGGYNLEGGEAVINRVSTAKYSGLLNTISMAGGGKPILVNNFDDSRIVDALAKQKQEPIRAYVVEQDISQKQAVSKRLQQLSKF